MHKLFITIIILFTLLVSKICQANERPNILLIIADDMGVDALNGYDIGTILPNTPHIDELRNAGVTFTNAWACPACAPTRASMLTGKYGANSGINTVPGILGTDQKSIFKEINELTDKAYETCVIGKWHNARPKDIDHPYLHGADDFMGVNGAGVDDYFNWTKVENKDTSACTDYTTSYFTDYAAQWIKEQTKPWFMWFAHVAPHTPFHVPPSDLYTSEDVNSNLQKFIAMIEAMDHEIGRLLDSIPQTELDNTVIMFVGDNGTAGNILQGYPSPKGKNTVYQGGIHVPLIVSGNGVSRQNETEDAMINVSDFYATIAQIAEPDAYPTNQVNDSYSFKHLLSNSSEPKRTYNYMELGANQTVSTDVYTIRNAQYKIIYDVKGNKEFFDLSADPYETNNLLLSELTTDQLSAKLDLEQQMLAINGISFEDEDSDDGTSIPTNKYNIVDTGVSDFYDNNSIISTPVSGEPFCGQDAHYSGNQPSYTNNGDGTITDNVTGLMWEQDMGEKISYADAFVKAKNSTLGGYSDWRVPTIKELYSLAQFTGRCFGDNAVDLFIDTDYFNHPIGDTSIGEREIDAQTWSSTQYTGLIMRGDTAVFGYNFVDGRLKGYPKYVKSTGEANTMYFRMVRGNEDYGINNFVDNGDGTITDLATGLMWQQGDDGTARNWEDALQYCEDLTHGGHSDWRLPNAKELHSILDYTRCPDVTNSPAIDPLFSCSSFNNPDGDANYGYYWTSSPLMDGPTPYTDAVYMCFGEAQGQMSFPPTNVAAIYDTHGAGASRNDPKEMGSDTYPDYFGPQGDIRYVNNYVRAVRNTDEKDDDSSVGDEASIDFSAYPNPTEGCFNIELERNYALLKVEIINIAGKTLSNYTFNNQNHLSINMVGPKGIYFVRIQASNGDTVVIKVIKE
ncbi:sulfatase-like hydrolase/transferase [Saccharicrinis sp. GN24d3]|uniref:sulfatase-like hydrolase/transferase n=1 Tax=Saccharicrinis sp. GN24d3 TaxID=3458416 RepID=UPI004035E869